MTEYMDSRRGNRGHRSNDYGGRGSQHQQYFDRQPSNTAKPPAFVYRDRGQSAPFMSSNPPMRSSNRPSIKLAKRQEGAVGSSSFKSKYCTYERTGQGAMVLTQGQPPAHNVGPQMCPTNSANIPEQMNCAGGGDWQVQGTVPMVMPTYVNNNPPTEWHNIPRNPYFVPADCCNKQFTPRMSPPPGLRVTSSAGYQQDASFVPYNCPPATMAPPMIYAPPWVAPQPPPMFMPPRLPRWTTPGMHQNVPYAPPVYAMPVAQQWQVDGVTYYSTPTQVYCPPPPRDNGGVMPESRGGPQAGVMPCMECVEGVQNLVMSDQVGPVQAANNVAVISPMPFPQEMECAKETVHNQQQQGLVVETVPYDQQTPHSIGQTAVETVPYHQQTPHSTGHPAETVPYHQQTPHSIGQTAVETVPYHQQTPHSTGHPAETVPYHQQAPHSTGQTAVETVPYHQQAPHNTGHTAETVPYHQQAPHNTGHTAETVPYQQQTPHSTGNPAETVPYYQQTPHSTGQTEAEAVPYYQQTPQSTGQTAVETVPYYQQTPHSTGQTAVTTVPHHQQMYFSDIDSSIALSHQQQPPFPRNAEMVPNRQPRKNVAPPVVRAETRVPLAPTHRTGNIRTYDTTKVDRKTIDKLIKAMAIEPVIADTQPKGCIHWNGCSLSSQQQAKQRKLKLQANSSEQYGNTPVAQTASHENAQPTVSCENAQPTASHENAQPTASHENAQPTASHENAQPTVSCENAQPTVSCENVQPTGSHENAQPTASHENAQPTASHENAQPTASHENAQPTAESENAQPTESEQQSEGICDNESNQKPDQIPQETLQDPKVGWDENTPADPMQQNRDPYFLETQPGQDMPEPMTLNFKEIFAQSEKARLEKLAAMTPIIKDTYVEHAAVAKMTQGEAESFRAMKNGIKAHYIDMAELIPSFIVSTGASQTSSAPKPPIPNPIRTFEEGFGIYPEIMAEIAKQGFTEPSPIQSQLWPCAMKGLDVVGIAQTGSGKTLAFLLPAMIHIESQITPREQRKSPTVLVLAPTRELAQQIDREVKKYSYKNIRSVCLYGGASRGEQIDALSFQTEIVIATPGRLNDLVQAGMLNLSEVSFLVLDEADEMLDSGFEPQINKALLQVRGDRQTVLTSATWPESVRRMAKNYTKDPVMVVVGTTDIRAVMSVKQNIIFLDSPEDRFNWIVDFLLKMSREEKAIIFVGKKSLADHLSSELTLMNISVQTIHGAMCQEDREQAIADMQSGTANILVATDVASRGIDIENVNHVINHQFPNSVEQYVHRIGRTGRAGKLGESHTFIGRQDWSSAKQLIGILEHAEQEVPQELRDMAQRYDNRRPSEGRGRGRGRGSYDRQSDGYSFGSFSGGRGRDRYESARPPRNVEPVMSSPAVVFDWGGEPPKIVSEGTEWEEKPVISGQSTEWGIGAGYDQSSRGGGYAQSSGGGGSAGYDQSLGSGGYDQTSGSGGHAGYDQSLGSGGYDQTSGSGGHAGYDQGLGSGGYDQSSGHRGNAGWGQNSGISGSEWAQISARGRSWNRNFERNERPAKDWGNRNSGERGRRGNWERNSRGGGGEEFPRGRGRGRGQREQGGQWTRNTGNQGCRYPN